jgi:hypothetical protein
MMLISIIEVASRTFCISSTEFKPDNEAQSQWLYDLNDRQAKYIYFYFKNQCFNTNNWTPKRELI